MRGSVNGEYCVGMGWESRIVEYWGLLGGKGSEMDENVM